MPKSIQLFALFALFWETEKSDAAFFSNQLVTLLIFSAEFNIAEIVRVVIKVSTEMQGVY